MFTSRATETAASGTPQPKQEPQQRDVTISHAWLLTGAVTFVLTVAAFVRNKTAALTLGPEGVGLYAQGLTFLAFAVTFCTLGMGQGIVKHLAERDRGPVGGVTRLQIIRTSLRVQLSIALLMAGAVVVLSKPLAQLLFGDPRAWVYVVIVGGAIPLTVLFTNLGFFLQGFKNLRDFSAASAINAVIGMAVFIPLVILFGLKGALLSLLATSAAGVLIFWMFYRRRALAGADDRGDELEKERSRITLELLKFGGVVFIGGVLETLTALLLRTWIVNFSGAAFNGIYQAVLGLSGQYIGFFVLFNNAYLYPKLSSLRLPAEKSAEINSALRTGLMLAVPLIAGVITFRQPLILLLFTSEFLPAAEVLKWQAVGDVLKITAWFISASLLPGGRLREYIGLSVIFSAIFMVLSFLFLRKWGLTGLAVAYCLSYVFYILLIIALQVKLIGFAFAPATLTVIFASLALLFVIVWLPNSAPVHYVLKVGLVSVWFFALGGKRFATLAIAGLREALPSAKGGTRSPVSESTADLFDARAPTVVQDGEVTSDQQQSPAVGAVGVIVPVKNEAASIERLIRALEAQTYRPAEIVIADGGSNDGTREIIRRVQLTSSLPIVLVEDDDAFPGKARNLAIRRAEHEWIACIDGGITPQPSWLRQLVAMAERVPRAEVIYGVARPVTNTYFTECAAITYVRGGGITQSIASCLLRRSAWDKVGGFREDLRSGEDVLFFQSLDAAGVQTVNCADAIVDWDLQPTIARTFWRFVTYSRNGMRAGLARQWQHNVSGLYLLMLICLVTGFWFWPLLLVPPALLMLRAEKRIWGWYRVQSPSRARREVLNLRRVLTVAFINGVIDLATFYGMAQWLWNDRWKPATQGRLSDPR